jgi:hypothetical protein
MRWRPRQRKRKVSEANRGSKPARMRSGVRIRVKVSMTGMEHSRRCASTLDTCAGWNRRYYTACLGHAAPRHPPQDSCITCSCNLLLSCVSDSLRAGSPAALASVPPADQPSLPPASRNCRHLLISLLCVCTQAEELPGGRNRFFAFAKKFRIAKSSADRARFPCRWLTVGVLR